ncbi:WD40 repeat-like protein [Rhizopogon vinicolor AM-OR11-026]|uniref:WD40 repeat-like protein n=1 Tax=Rhizopogon vinicolor AM-OR11-026 TaxID=1314800 RepID=A0A1B7MQS6_9AGAM|nr:WD40 repeat-like protein [Rhizopogon vinicolor AM-OR11-026]
MTSWNRPLPGVRLDAPGDLVPGCEWHISPLGRSYFVNHNTRTTSWQKPTPERPAGSLTPECVMEGHSMCIWSLACVGASYNIVSASGDGSIRQWKRHGEQVGKPWRSEGRPVGSIAVSPDETMVVSGNIDGIVQLWKEGKMVRDPWKAHNAAVRCLDWSPNACEVTSGSQDGTIRRWNPDTGRQIALPIETGHGWVNTVKYSSQGDNFASGGSDDMIRVWSMDGKLLIEIKGHDNSVNSLCWSKDGAHILSGSSDNTIRKWRLIDGKELVVLRGHTNQVRSIFLSPDERHLISASYGCLVYIWDLKANEQVGEPLLHDDDLMAVAISSDGRYIASAGKDQKIYLWNIEAALKKGDDQVRVRVYIPVISPFSNRRCMMATHSPSQSSRQVIQVLDGLLNLVLFISQERAALSGDVLNHVAPSKRQAHNKVLSRYGDDFWGDNINRSPHRSAPSTDPPPRRNLLDFILFNVRPVGTSQPLPLQSRRWNASLIPVRISRHRVDVAPCRIDDRIATASPTKAEVDAAMAAALQQVSGNAVDSQTSQSQAAAMVQGPQVVTQGQPSQGQHPSSGVEEPSYEMGCCGFYVHFGRRRST